MSCTVVEPALQHARDRISQTQGVRAGDINPEVLATLRRFGWVYKHAGRLDLTGAGAYHTGSVKRWAGMLA